MKHPNREEWVPFLFGESIPPDRKKLAEHLQHCPSCRAEMESWQRSLRRLDAWELPPPRLRRESYQPGLKWAMAAVVVLGLGLGLGRLTIPALPDAAQRSAELESAVSAALAAHAAALRQQIGSELQAALLRAEAQRSNGLALLEVRLASQAQAETSRVWQEWAQLVDKTRDEDREELGAVLQRLQQEHDTDLLELRRDLETVASFTDDGIRQANLRLSELAAVSPADLDP